MSERKIDFSDYKVGDRVWSIVKQEWVEIVKKCDPDCEWAFRLSDGYLITKEGKTRVGGSPLYFPNSFEIPDEAYRRPLPELAVDTPIWVRDNDNYQWQPRHFLQWSVDGMVHVFAMGRTSHTNMDDQDCVLYAQWSLTKPENDG